MSSAGNKARELTILTRLSLRFDHGQAVEHPVPEEWNLQPGDRVNCRYAHFSGVAVVAERRGDYCVIKKIV